MDVSSCAQANKHEFELSEIEKLLKVGGPDSTNDLVRFLAESFGDMMSDASSRLDPLDRLYST